LLRIVYIQPLRGELKVPLFKGDLGGSLIVKNSLHTASEKKAIAPTMIKTRDKMNCE
jgi:hypothetical protein